MAKKKPVKKRMKHKPLPPHSYEPFPLTEKGEVNRPLLVAIISVLIAVALVVILFVAEPASVGKAYTGVEGAAGLVAIAGDNFVVDSPFTLTVRANIGAAETVAIGFNLTLPEGVSCVRESVDLGWEATDEGDALVLNNSECDENQVSLEYATLEFEAAQTETFDIARIALQASEAGDYDLNFSLFDIYSLSDAPVDLIENAEDLTITVGGGEGSESVLTLYQHCKDDPNFDTGWEAELEVGSYDTAALEAAGVLNNDASALEVAEGYQVALYDSNDLTGEPLIITSDVGCLVDVGGNFNEVLSSMVVSEVIPTECTLETDCLITQYCSSGGSCIDKRDIGGACSANISCLSNNCDIEGDGDADGIGDHICVAEIPTCDADHLDLCLEEECALESGVWDLDLGCIPEDDLTITGVRVELTELTSTSTMLTALADFNETVTAYTVLRSDNLTVVILQEVIDGMVAGEEKVLEVAYTESVNNKEVLVFDRLPHQSPTVSVTMSRDYE